MFFRRTNHSLKLLPLIHRFSQEISEILSLKDLLRRFLRAFSEIAQTPRASVLLLEESIKSFVVRESVGPDPLIIQFSPKNPLLNYLAQTKEPLTISELLSNLALIDIRESGVSFFTAVNAALILPLFVEHRVLGFLTLGQSHHAYSEEQLELFAVLATMGSFSIGNAILYDSLAKQNLKLAEVAELKTQFVSTVSHELSTPVHGVLGMSEVLLEMNHENLEDDQKRYLQMIHTAAQELNEIVDKILHLTRFQSQQRELQVRRIDLSQTIHELHQDLEPQLSEKNIRFESAVPTSLGVYGDKSQIRELFRSLIENAVKFSADPANSKVIGVQASRSGDMLKVCVYDSGIGIEDSDQERIFEDFRQAESDLHRSFGGTGLGLSLAKKIVELHGGRIWVESKKGQGAQFFFTLPLIPSHVGATEIDSERLN